MGLKRFFQQVWTEATLPRRKPTSVPVIVKDIDGMGFKLKCLMAQGGYRFKPPAMKDEEVKAIADSVGPETVNFIVMLRSAEDVLERHGLIPEYLDQCKEAQKGAADSMKAKMDGLYSIVQNAIKQAGTKELRKQAGMEADPMGMVLGDATKEN